MCFLIRNVPAEAAVLCLVHLDFKSPGPVSKTSGLVTDEKNFN